MNERDMIRELRRTPKMRLQCKGLGEFVFLVATARMTWRLSGGDEKAMAASFSPHVVDLARLDEADYLVGLVRESSVHPPVGKA